MDIEEQFRAKMEEAKMYDDPRLAEWFGSGVIRTLGHAGVQVFDHDIYLLKNDDNTKSICVQANISGAVASSSHTNLDGVRRALESGNFNDIINLITACVVVISLDSIVYYQSAVGQISPLEVIMGKNETKIEAPSVENNN